MDIELLVLSPKRKQHHLPKPTPIEIAHAQRYGIVTPVVIKSTPLQINNVLQYEILQNEMAWYIAQRIGLPRVPVTKIDINEEEVGVLLQLVPDNPIEEALQIQKYLNQHPQPIAEMARKLGKNRVDVSNQLRLLTLDPYCQHLLKENKLTVGQAKPMVTLKQKDQRELAQQAVIKKWSSRKIEQKAREIRTQRQQEIPPANDVDTRTMEEMISLNLGCPAKIVDGKLTINYFGDLEILDGLLIQMGIKQVEKTDEKWREEFVV